MATEDHLETRVRVLPPILLSTPKDASLTLRGKTLILNTVHTHCFISQFFEITGATAESKNQSLADVLDWPTWLTLGVSLTLCVWLISYPAVSALTNRSSPIVSIVVFGVICFLLVTALEVRRRRRPTVHLRLNVRDTVHDLVLEYIPGTNPTLDAIIQHFRPFEVMLHRYTSRPKACIETDWLRAFPRRFALFHSSPRMLYVFFIPLLAYRFLGNTHPFYLWIPAGATLVVGLSTFILWRNFRKDRMQPPYRDRQRKIMRHLAQGDSESATAALNTLLADYPGDDDALLLHAHLAIANSNFDAGMAYLNQVSDERTKERAKMESQCEIARGLES